MYNENYYSTIQMASFETLNGRRYRSPIVWFKVGDAILIALNSTYEVMLKVQLIRKRLRMTQNHQKSYTNVRCRKLEVWFWWFCQLQSLTYERVKRFKKYWKLYYWFIGPSEIVDHFGKIANELDFPVDLAAVHLVFLCFLSKEVCWWSRIEFTVRMYGPER